MIKNKKHKLTKNGWNWRKSVLLCVWNCMSLWNSTKWHGLLYVGTNFKLPQPFQNPRHYHNSPISHSQLIIAGSKPLRFLSFWKRFSTSRCRYLYSSSSGLRCIVHIGKNFLVLEIKVIQDSLSINDIVSSAWRQMKVKGIAKPVNNSVNFGG